MGYHYKQGWYKVVNTSKFIKPLDEYMKSYRRDDKGVYIQYKSSLEKIAFRYADMNPKIKYFSIEPFNIKYVKPTDNKVHRYFIDMYIEFVTGDKFLVEIKPYSQTIYPANKNAQDIVTYMINIAKWKAAKTFSKLNNMNFIILTEKELKRGYK